MFLETEFLKGIFMRNLKEWFSAGDLSKIDGFPKTPQGVNKKARIQGWIKRQKEGVQGGAVEYHYSSFPLELQIALGFEPETKKEIKDSHNSNKLSISELEATIHKLETMLSRIREDLPKPQTDNGFKLNWSERKLIENYRKISMANKEIIDELVEKMAGLNSEKETSEPFEAYKVA